MGKEAFARGRRSILGQNSREKHPTFDPPGACPGGFREVLKGCEDREDGIERGRPWYPDELAGYTTFADPSAEASYS